MAVNKLNCPECNATLKFGQPVSAGKRIKCPKCSSSFVVPEEEEEEAPPPPKPAAAKPSRTRGDDEDDDSPYTVREKEREEKPEKGKKSMFEEPLRDRFPKSKRGPAQAAVIPPSNGLIAAGILTCIFYLVMMVATVFPVIFSSSSDTPITTKRAASPGPSATARSPAPPASENPPQQSKNGMTGEHGGTC